MKKVEQVLEQTIFRSRWLLAPVYFGLVIGLALLVIKFVQALIHSVGHILEISESQAILDVLALVDLSLAANLVLMVIFSGYENFVSKIDTADHHDRPDWMGKIDYGGLKLKLLASIVAISAIQLLRAFIQLEDYTDMQLAWMVGIHLMFVVSGVLLAWMDRITGHQH